MLKSLVLALTMCASGAQAASVCDEVQRRIGAERMFQNFIPGSAVNPQLLLRRITGAEYAITAGERHGRFTLKSFGPLCFLKAQGENSHFAAGKHFGLTIPNRAGECWVAMARISKLVPPDQEPAFIAGGFCVSPLAWDPEAMWLGTSVLTPL